MPINPVTLNTRPSYRPAVDGSPPAPSIDAVGAGTSIRRGQKGESVKTVQQLLNTRGAQPPLAEDGDFGAKTETAVRRFQANAGLDVDGVVGTKTLQALQSGSSVESEVTRRNRTTAAASTGGSAETTAPPDPPRSTRALNTTRGITPEVAPLDASRTAPRPNDRNASQIEEILKKQAPAGSPLRDPKVRQEVADALVRVSEKEGVPAWLMLTHMKLENGFGRPDDATMKSNRPWYSTEMGHGPTNDPSRLTGEKGPSHNLFGLTMPKGYEGNYIVSRDMPQGMRVFDSFEKSIETVGATLSKHYRGLSVNDYIDQYYIGDQRNNQKRAIISMAEQWGGRSLDLDSVVLPER